MENLQESLCVHNIVLLQQNVVQLLGADVPVTGDVCVAEGSEKSGEVFRKRVPKKKQSRYWYFIIIAISWNLPELLFDLNRCESVSTVVHLFLSDVHLSQLLPHQVGVHPVCIVHYDVGTEAPLVVSFEHHPHQLRELLETHTVFAFQVVHAPKSLKLRRTHRQVELPEKSSELCLCHLAIRVLFHQPEGLQRNQFVLNTIREYVNLPLQIFKDL